MELTPGYCAGFFDGEGSVYAAQRKSRKGNSAPTILVCITNTNKNIMQMHKDKWGGSLCLRYKGDKWQTQYQWVLSPRMAYIYLSYIYSHLIIKKEVVTKALEYCSIQSLPRKQIMKWETININGKLRCRMKRQEWADDKLKSLHSDIRELNKRGAPFNALRKESVNN